LYWRRANTLGAYLAIGLGLLTWLPLELFMPESAIPPQFAGFLMACVGMIAGALLSSGSRSHPPQHR
jgi:Na+/proline symporter